MNVKQQIHQIVVVDLGAGQTQNPPSTFASGGQKPFREKVSGLPKAFHWYGLSN
ncbi:MAG: hypothetical protein PVH61_01490 [Candidatus Aminicenantes bacterium]